MLKERLKETIRDIYDFPKKGIIFKDITPVLEDPNLCKQILDEIISSLKGLHLDAVVGVESRGFLFGMMLANKLNIPFVPVRKKGKLPYDVVTQKYDLEYGSAELEMHIDSIDKNWNILVHDDLLATGGTACATSELIQELGGNITAFVFIIAIESLNGSQILHKYSDKIITLINY